MHAVLFELHWNGMKLVLTVLLSFVFRRTAAGFRITSIPSEIGLLTELEYMSLGTCGFGPNGGGLEWNACIPDGEAFLPSEIGLLTNLKLLSTSIPSDTIYFVP
jgi:hypothetical protein